MLIPAALASQVRIPNERFRSGIFLNHLPATINASPSEAGSPLSAVSSAVRFNLAHEIQQNLCSQTHISVEHMKHSTKP